jgi:hypothetical protein
MGRSGKIYPQAALVINKRFGLIWPVIAPFRLIYSAGEKYFAATVAN